MPLNKSAKLLVAGPASNSVSALHGCWSFTWQGRDATQYPADAKTIVDCLRAKVGVQNIIHHPGCSFEGALPNAEAIIKDADGCDAIVLCLGEEAYAETPGDINELNLPPAQIELAHQLIATGRPVVLVMVEGRCRVIREVVPGSKAVLLAFLPGSEGAQAIANIILGDANPSAKLPCTYPRYANHLITYDRNTTSRLDEDMPPEGHTSEEYRPQFEFGIGLSYTTFTSTNLRIDSTSYKTDGEINIQVDITNTGKRSGMETVEVYSRQMYASITPPLRRLRAFKKIELQSGESMTVQFKLPVSELAIVNDQNQIVVEPGDFEIMVAGEKVAFKIE